MGAKTRSLDVSSTASVEIEQLREVWAGQVNDALERHLIEQRVDHRSFGRQGLVQEPGIHLGVAATGMERKAAREELDWWPVTERGRENAAIRRRNEVLEAARKAAEKAQEFFEGLEKRARLAVGLARRLGQRVGQEREAERQRKELVRQAELRRQADIRAAEDARKADVLEQQKQCQQEAEQARSRGLSRSRSHDSGPSI